MIPLHYVRADVNKAFPKTCLLTFQSESPPDDSS